MTAGDMPKLMSQAKQNSTCMFMFFRKSYNWTLRNLYSNRIHLF